MAFGKEGPGESAWTKLDPSLTPHWMRLLEEKYQRLHAKIVNQAVKFAPRRNSKFFHGRTAQCFKTARQPGKAAAVPGNSVEPDYNPFTQALQAATVDTTPVTDKANEADISNPDAKANEGRNSISPYCEKHLPHNCGGGNASHVNSSTGDSDRLPKIVPIQNCFENEASLPYKETPLNSCGGTRVSSALALTRLSSALDNSRLNSRSNSRAGGGDYITDELSAALHLQLTECVQEESDDLDNCDDVDVNENEDRTSQCHTDRKEMEVSNSRRRQRQLSRPVKTSVSHISHKTSSSCPAFVWDNNNGITLGISETKLTHENLNRHNVKNENSINKRNSGDFSGDLPGHSIPLKSRGVQDSRMRVFARMSLEAQHAIDETRKEMKQVEKTQSDFIDTRPPTSGWDDFGGEDNGVDDTNDSIQPNLSGVAVDDSGCDGGEEYDYVDDNKSLTAESDMSLPSVNEDGSVPPNKPSNDRLHNRNANMNGLSSNYDNCVMGRGNRTATKGQKVLRRRLPHIEHNSAAQTVSFPNPHSRLPGIGQFYPPYRENTFEITPFDFDIRFREIITCQQGGRETPPPDVRQQSIDKCQEWLNRHTPRR